MRRNARRRLDLLGRFVPAGRLLDVGCAAGFFVDESLRRGWEAAGVEGLACDDVVRAEPAGLEVAEAQFDRAQLSGPYDALTMWDYLEHTIDPVADLRRAFSLLRPGGMLVLSTGDAGSLVARASGRRWHLLTPRHHNFFFDRRTLKRALAEAGFHIRHAGTLACRYSLHYLAHKLQTMGTPLAGRVTSGLEGTAWARSLPRRSLRHRHRGRSTARRASASDSRRAPAPDDCSTGTPSAPRQSPIDAQLVNVTARPRGGATPTCAKASIRV